MLWSSLHATRRRFNAVGSMLKSLVSSLRCHAFDLWHDVETCGDAELDSLRIDGPNRVHGVHYQPTHPKLIRETLDGLPIDYPQFAFVDYGSGKGRVLLVATQYPFKQIFGVEFSKELHDVAVMNVQKFRGRRLCHQINCVHEDAANFDPPLDPLVIFMFNPFRPPVMKTVMEKISHSLLSRPREAWLIYLTPYHSHLVAHPFALVGEMQYYSLYRAPALSPDELP